MAEHLFGVQVRRGCPNGAPSGQTTVTYTTLDSPSISRSIKEIVSRRINNASTIAGFSLESSYGTPQASGLFHNGGWSTQQFYRVARCTHGLNNLGETVGNYVNGLSANGNNNAFVQINGLYTTLDDLLATSGTVAQSIDDERQTVDNYTDSQIPTDAPALRVGATLGWAALATTPALVVIPIYCRFLAADWFLYTALSALGILIAVVVLGVVVTRRGWSFRNYMALTRPQSGALRIGIVSQMALWLALLGYMFIPLLSAGAAAPHIELIDPARLAQIVPWFWAFKVVIITPIGEEIVFRGFMYRGLAQSRMEPVCAILTISLIFSVVHFDHSTLWHAACGFLYGCLRWRTGSTWVPIAAHITNNLVAFIFSVLVVVTPG